MCTSFSSSDYTSKTILLNTCYYLLPFSIYFLHVHFSSKTVLLEKKIRALNLISLILQADSLHRYSRTVLAAEELCAMKSF